MKLKRLPPLKSLVYFEASARLQSFTRASAELNVTQGAVSRQIRQLEQFLHCDLFRRENRQVFLTDEGHNYYASIAHILQQLDQVTVNLIDPVDANTITLVTSNALASMYLLPRIPAFRQSHPDIQIRIVARDDIASLGQIDYDLGFFYARTPPKDCDCIALFGEEIFPVCSPDYFASHEQRFGTTTVLSTDLIWQDGEEDWINWPEWFQAMHINVEKVYNRLVVNHYPMVIQAAIAGQGIALAWSHLVDHEIASGTLVRPTNLSLKTDSSFFLIRPTNEAIRQGALKFSDWLKRESR